MFTDSANGLISPCVKSFITRPLSGFAVASSIVFALFYSARAQEFKLPLTESGAMPKIGYYMPQQLKLSTNRPASLKKAPEDLVSPLFGEIKMGPKDKRATIIVAVDEPDDKPWRLLVDSNGNGDLTDDPAAEWKVRELPGDGPKLKQSSGGAKVKVSYGSETLEYHLSMYRFDKSDTRRAALRNVLLYFRDYARFGSITLGDKTYSAILSDSFATGDFRGSTNAPVDLILDVNHDGKFDGRFEQFNVLKPFNIAGTTYEIAELTPSGDSFKIVKSSQTVAETKPAPNLKPGQKALPFKVKDMAGKQVDFPGDFKGKLVMLDFWATWCVPCMEELPNLVKNYEKFHDQGFEVLGVTLDDKKAEAKIAKVTEEKKMTWPQIYDGKVWEAEIASLYYVDGIPRGLLVDGDTGKILAADDELHGPKLPETLAKVLKERK
jgi:thiol-disulfide isomerase/thioredoxin